MPLLALSSSAAGVLLILNIHLDMADQLITAFISALFFESISLSYTNCSRIPAHHNVSGEISAVCILTFAFALMFPNTPIIVLIIIYALSSFAITKLIAPSLSLFGGLAAHIVCAAFILLTSSLFRTELPLQLLSGSFIFSAYILIPACALFTAMHLISKFNILEYQTQNSMHSHSLSAVISSFSIIRPILIFALFFANGYISPPFFIYQSSMSNRVLSFMLTLSFFLIAPIARYAHAGIIAAAASMLLCYIVYIFYRKRLVPNDHSPRSFIFEIRKKYS